MKNNGDAICLFVVPRVVSIAIAGSRNANFTCSVKITASEISLRARDRRCLYYRGARFVSARCQMKNNFATLQPFTFP